MFSTNDPDCWEDCEESITEEEEVLFYWTEERSNFFCSHTKLVA